MIFLVVSSVDVSYTIVGRHWVRLILVYLWSTPTKLNPTLFLKKGDQRAQMNIFKLGQKRWILNEELSCYCQRSRHFEIQLFLRELGYKVNYELESCIVQYWIFTDALKGYSNSML